MAKMTVAALNRTETAKAKRGEPFAARCAWFAGCGRAATGTTPHPVLGDVPTCDRCHKFATGADRAES